VLLNQNRKFLVRRLVALVLILGVFVGVSAGVAAGVTWVGAQLTALFNPGSQKPAYDVDTASSLTVVVNKARPLSPLTYHPRKMGSVELAKPAADAFLKLQAAAHKAGAGELKIESGFRDFATQQDTYLHYTAALGMNAGENRAAKPGFSEHQTGLAADISATDQTCAIKICFAKTKAGKWIARHAYKYGFILRYPKGATAVTGYQFEPWHYRFVGKKLAAEMHAAKATVLETYLGLPDAPDYVLRSVSPTAAN
jgi:zinc D-Ala-D-Ala carboxypeptidase